MSALEEVFGAPSPGLAATLSHPMGDGASLRREMKGEVVLVSRLFSALERLSASRAGGPALPSEAITAAADERTRDRLAVNLAAGQVELETLPQTAGRIWSAPSTACRRWSLS